MKRVFIYCRVSTASQTDGDGFDRQESACRAFADRQGWKVVRVFREQQSGSDEWTDRKLLSEAVELSTQEQPEVYRTVEGASVNAYNFGVCRSADPIDTIIVERADRIARDLIVSELFLRDCKSRGVRIYAADSHEEIVNGNGDPTRTLIRQVLAAVSQWEKTVIVKKMQAGRKATALKTGKPCGGRTPDPYGDRGSIGQRNEERNIIRQILAMRRENKSFKYIAERLWLARIKNPNGDWGRRVPGVNPPFIWSGKMVERIVNRWEDRIDL